MLRICRQCQTGYEGDPGSTLCPDCVKANRQTTIRDRICRECGRSFPGGPRAWYCPGCRAERRRAQSREGKRREAAGAARKLGSTDLCTICGKPYTVTGGLQRYCPTCAPDAVREIDRVQARTWYADNADPTQRYADRKQATAPRYCMICGKPYAPKSNARTCSPECRAAYRRRYSRGYERAHPGRKEKKHD